MPTILTDPSDIIAATAKQWMKATVTISDPSQSTTTPYDPATDSGGETVAAVLVTTKARVQHLGNATPFVVEGAWMTRMAYNISFPLENYPALIPGGMKVKVTDGGKDVSLTEIELTVLAGAGSSSAAIRTLRCMSEMVPA